MKSNLKKKFFLFLLVSSELIVGFLFLHNYYYKKFINKLPDQDKIAIINKENLIFPEASEFKYYWELKPNSVVFDQPDWLGYQAKYTYNADGLNERFDYKVEKPANTFRIIALGDSFTFGQYVNTEDNWPEQLEILLNRSLDNNSKLKKFEVINLGLGGFDVPYIVKRYKDIGAKYNPDLIIWFENGEGFHRMVELIMPIVDVCEKEISEVDRKKEFHYCWNRAGEKLTEKYLGNEIDNFIIDELNHFFLSLKSDQDFIFFTYQEDNLGEFKLHSLKQWQEKLARFHNVDFAAVVPGIYNLRQVLADGHPTIEGHKTIATAIYEYLKLKFSIISTLE